MEYDAETVLLGFCTLREMQQAVSMKITVACKSSMNWPVFYLCSALHQPVKMQLFSGDIIKMCYQLLTEATLQAAFTAKHNQTS